jgi:hypothetical protein
MADYDIDELNSAFADFRSGVMPIVHPAGYQQARTTAQRRRTVRTAALACAAVVLVGVSAATGVAVANRNHAAPAGGVGPAPTASAAAPASPSASPTTGPGSPSATAAPGVPPASGVPSQVTSCRAAQLTAAVTDSGSQSSQPFVVIALTNTSASVCELTGYPQITATGYASSTPATTGKLQVTVTDGAIYERGDPGPQRIELSPHASASFALGTATAYDGGAHLYSITRLGITVPGDQTSVPVTVNIAASSPANQPIPVTVTALVAGQAGPR